jgi:carboxymethylenebutenolidase
MNKNITIEGSATYHTYPDEKGNHPGLIVLEEIWGVNAHVKSVADRFAKAGYSVLSPELLPEGLLAIATPQLQKDMFDPEKRDAAQPKIREAMGPMSQPEFAQKTIKILKACVDYLLADKGVNGNIAVLGFCFGGTYAFHLAAHDERIKAAVPFYGQAPSEEEIKSINSPILAFYGDQDTRLMEALPKVKEEMQRLGKDFEAVVYPNVGHAFFNDTNARQYNAEAATDAWNKTLAFLKKNIG